MELSAQLDADLADAIAGAVASREDDLVDLIQRLVQFPSLTGSEGDLQAFAAAYMQDMRLDTDVWEPIPADLEPYIDQVGFQASYAGRPNVVGVWRGSGTGRSIILNAHIDVVDAGDPERWRFDPYAGVVAEGRVFGRGACDMKAGLATNLIAVQVLRDLGVELAGDVIVESVISEEDGGAGALATILRGYRADGAVITEPTNLAVVAAQGGSLVFRLTVPGKAAHAAIRDEGVNPIEKFIPLYQALQQFEADRNSAIHHPLYASVRNKIPISFGVVRAGTWPSSVPETLVAEGRAGLVAGENLDEFRAEVTAVIAAAAAPDPWFEEHPPTVEWFSGQFAPAEVPTDHPLVVAVQRAHATVTGSPPSVEGVPYGADMRHFLHTGGMPCLMYGAGDVRLAHHTDESVLIADVVTATRTVALLLAEWCGVTVND